MSCLAVTGSSSGVVSALLCSALLYVLCLLYCHLLCCSACSAVPSSSRRQRRRRCCRRRCCCYCCRCCCVRTTNALLSVCMVLTPFFRYYSPPMPTDCVLRVSADIYLSIHANFLHVWSSRITTNTSAIEAHSAAGHSTAGP